jgi:hypothetical protein
MQEQKRKIISTMNCDSNIECLLIFIDTHTYLRYLNISTILIYQA